MKKLISRYELLRTKFIEKLNFDSIVVNEELWFSSINEILEAYVQTSPYYQHFGEDVILNLTKIKKPPVYAKLADAAITICEQFNWSQDQEKIVDFLLADKRLVNPTGKLKKLVAMKEVSVGSQAPNLYLTSLYHTDNEKHIHDTLVLKTNELASKYSLIVFYQSGCGSCEITMEMLRANYQDLRKKELRVISISSDEDEQIFKNTAESYPWSDKFCDLKGFKGVNFINYAIVGTPTLFLLDNKGIILSKFATIEELLKWFKEHP